MNFRDRVVVVTGGLSGIGRAIAEAFSEREANVVVFDHRDRSRDDEVEGEEFAARLGTGGRFVRGDVRSEADIASLFDFVQQGWQRCDVVVNSAGVNVFRDFSELTVSDFDLVMEVNVKGTFLVCRRALKLMMSAATDGASIVNIASNFAFVGDRGTSIYSASKGAVVSLTRALAVEYGGSGIRINALCPGATSTEFNRSFRENNPAVVDRWRAKTPLRMRGRDSFLASSRDIAGAALFLSSDAAAYMTGSSVVIDGGWNAE